jgi:hypothetical protein
VTAFSWAEDGSAVYFIQDTNGDENDHLYMVPLSSLTPNGQPVKPIDLTPFKGVKASTIIGSKRFPGVTRARWDLACLVVGFRPCTCTVPLKLLALDSYDLHVSSRA